MNMLLGMIPIILILVVGAIFLQYRSQAYLAAENRNLMLQQKLLLEYNDSMSAQIALTDQLQNDILENLELLNALIAQIGEKPEFSVYASALREQYRNLSEQNYHKGTIVDYFVHTMMKLCEEEGISGTVEQLPVESGALTEEELLTLISVLFDTGLEICGQLDKTAKRTMAFCGEAAEGSLLLRLRLGTDGHMGSRALSLFPRTKNSYLDVVGDILKKYQGTFQQEIQRHQILLTISVRTEG